MIGLFTAYLLKKKLFGLVEGMMSLGEGRVCFLVDV